MNASTQGSDFPLVYKGRPLMRKETMIYYGSMADKYIIMMQVASSEPLKDIKLSGRVSVQLQLTDPEISSRDRVVKSTEKDGLWNALDIASIWLERALSGK